MFDKFKSTKDANHKAFSMFEKIFNNIAKDIGNAREFLLKNFPTIPDNNREAISTLIKYYTYSLKLVQAELEGVLTEMDFQANYIKMQKSMEEIQKAARTYHQNDNLDTLLIQAQLQAKEKPIQFSMGANVEKPKCQVCEERGIDINKCPQCKSGNVVFGNSPLKNAVSCTDCGCLFQITFNAGTEEHTGNYIIEKGSKEAYLKLRENTEIRKEQTTCKDMDLHSIIGAILGYLGGGFTFTNDRIKINKAFYNLYYNNPKYGKLFLIPVGNIYAATCVGINDIIDNLIISRLLLPKYENCYEVTCALYTNYFQNTSIIPNEEIHQLIYAAMEDFRECIKK